MCALLEGELTRTSEAEAITCEMRLLKVKSGAGDCCGLKMLDFQILNKTVLSKKCENDMKKPKKFFYLFAYPLESHYARRGRIKHKADRIY